MYQHSGVPFIRSEVVTFIKILLFVSGSLTSALKLDRVIVPYHQVSGSRVRLTCPFVLDGVELYSVKWYRGAHEFFRYVPKDRPDPIHVYNLPGVKVDTAASDERNVELHPVTLESSGSYKCEVSAEFPSYFTISKEAHMQVVEIPVAGPQLTGVLDHYAQGEVINATCTSQRSRPAASLNWYINGKQAERQHLEQYAPEQEGTLETALLGLRLRITSARVEENFLTLNCTASIAAVYWDSTAVTVKLTATRNSLESALESKVVVRGGGSCSSLPPLLLLVLVLQVLPLLVYN